MKIVIEFPPTDVEDNSSLHARFSSAVEMEGLIIESERRYLDGCAYCDLDWQGDPEFWGLVGKRVKVTVIIEEADDER